MHRSIIIAGAFALAALPALTLAAPSGGQTHHRAPAPIARAAAPSRSFGVPMRPLTMPQHVALHTPAEFIPQPISANQRFALLPARGSFWYPPLLTPACAAGFATARQQPASFTLGSLVDGKSNLLSPAKHGAGVTKAGALDGSDSNHFTVKIAAYQPGCALP